MLECISLNFDSVSTLSPGCLPFYTTKSAALTMLLTALVHVSWILLRSLSLFADRDELLKSVTYLNFSSVFMFEEHVVALSNLTYSFSLG